MLPQTVSVTELTWTLVGGVGFLINIIALIDAYGDLRALALSGRNGARSIAARGNVRREWFRIFIQFVFAAMGIYAMTQAPANPRNVVTAAAIVITVGLVLAEVSLVIGSALDRAERVRLIAYIDRHYDAQGGMVDGTR